MNVLTKDTKHRLGLPLCMLSLQIQQQERLLLRPQRAVPPQQQHLHPLLAPHRCVGDVPLSALGGISRLRSVGLSEVVAAAATANARDGARKRRTGKEVRLLRWFLLTHLAQPAEALHLRERVQAGERGNATTTPLVANTKRTERVVPLVVVLLPSRISSSAAMHRLLQAKYRPFTAPNLPATISKHRLHAGVGGAGAVGAVDTVGADNVPLSMVSVCTTPADQITADDIMYAADSSAPRWILHLDRWFIVHPAVVSGSTHTSRGA